MIGLGLPESLPEHRVREQLTEYVEGKSLQMLIDERHHLDPAERSISCWSCSASSNTCTAEFRRSCTATSIRPTSSCGRTDSRRWSTSAPYAPPFIHRATMGRRWSDDAGPVRAVVASGTGLNRAIDTAGPRILQAVSDLPPAPRPIEGAVRDRFRAVAPRAWQYMNADGDRQNGLDKAISGAVLVFLGVVTVGILPALVWTKAAARRSKLKLFFQEGAAVALITSMQDEKTEFGVKVTRIRYEWEADGRYHRDSDEVFSSRGDRWREGDQIEIFYIPDRGYDSVIVEQ